MRAVSLQHENRFQGGGKKIDKVVLRRKGLASTLMMRVRYTQPSFDRMSVLTPDLITAEYHSVLYAARKRRAPIIRITSRNNFIDGQRMVLNRFRSEWRRGSDGDGEILACEDGNSIQIWMWRPPSEAESPCIHADGIFFWRWLRYAIAAGRQHFNFRNLYPLSPILAPS